MCASAFATANNQLEPAPEVALLPLWEISQMMKCPLVGTCLSVDEHRKLLKKAGFMVRKMQPHELHAAVMENIDTETRVARRIDTFLKKRYGAIAEELLHVSEGELRKRWRTALDTGDLEGLLYAIVSRNTTSVSFLSEIFGTLHMLGHTAKRDLMESRRLMQKSAQEQAALRRELQELKAKTGELTKNNRALEKELAARPKAAPTSVPPSAVKKPVAKNEGPTDSMAGQVVRLRDKNQALKERIARLESEREDLRRSLMRQPQAETIQEEPVSPPCSAGGCQPENCPLDLCCKKILVVGGLKGMKSRYREVVENSGGRFEYHDGCLHGGRQGLEARVRRSDVILCPVNCNSHGACWAVKDLCRKYGKCLRMLDSSSKTAISAALSETVRSDVLPLSAVPHISGTRSSAPS